MGNPTKSKIGFGRRFYLVWLLLSNPTEFGQEETKDSKLRGALPKAQELSKAEKVRVASLMSFAIVAFSGVLGVAVGAVLRSIVGAPSGALIAALQSVGALVLLLATIAVRGNEIATWDGVSLSERVNRWIFEVLYVVGTTMLVLSVSW